MGYKCSHEASYRYTASPSRVLLLVSVSLKDMAPLDSGEVCSMGPCIVKGIEVVYIGVQIPGPC